MQPTHQIQHIQQSWQKLSFFRWFLLLWMALIYLWGVQWGSVIKEQIDSAAFLPFTLLMVLHVGLYATSSVWSSRSQRSRLLYVAVQALLIIAISLVAHRFTVTLGLYLALTGEMVSVLRTIRMALLAGAAFLLLFSLNLDLLFGWQHVPILSQRALPLHIALLAVLPLFVLVVGYALRQARAHAQTQALLRELEQAHRQLADDSIHMEALTRAAERQRMARELHDTLAQGLAGLILQLEAVKAHLNEHRETRALEIVTQALGRARTSLAAARCAIDDLRVEAITPAELHRALEEEIGRFTAATGIPCTTQVSALSQVSEASGESMVRSVAEGLLNVARHAQASRVWVSVAQHDGGLTIEVRDNGSGFDPATLPQQGHYGLLGLRERARLLGGQFALTTAPGKGTTLRLLLPVPNKGAAQ